VTEAIKAGFTDVLDKERQRPLHFTGENADRVADAPRFAIRTASLGESIGRPEVQNNVSGFVGGVAFVIDGLEQPVQLADVQNRIRAMQLAPNFEQVGVVPFDVIGLDKAPSAEGDPTARYNSFAVVVRDDNTNYVEDPEAIDAVDGMADVQWSLVREALLRDTSLGSVTQFSPQISGTIQQQALAAMFLSCLAILIYVWFRFGSLRYGLAAIIALVHDVLVALSIMAIAAHLSETTIGDMLQITAFRLDLAQVAAFLTLIGYSLNDTIVVFDRIRENRGRLAFASPAIINDSINQTISRTILTGSTTAIAVFLLYVIGGPGVHGFAFTMLVGVVVGTYSSIAIAAPTMLIGQRFSSAKRQDETTTSPEPTS
jgi:SecD/SecF fusion protein